MLMKAHLVTLIMASVVPILHVALIRILRRPEGAIRLMFLVFLIYLLVLGLLYTSMALGWFMIGPAALAVSICLIYMELFSMLCRGFSLGIISVIHDNRSMKTGEICSLYGDGRGVLWMIQKRIDSIEKIGLVTREDKQLRIHSKIGLVVGRCAQLYKALIKIGPGGI